jgi:acyl carrier protein
VKPTHLAAATKQDETHLKDRLRQFILANFWVPDAQAIKDGTSLLDSGVVDSTGILEIIGFLESEFGIKVLDEEIVPDNLDSVQRIADYLARKLEGAGLEAAADT